MKASEETDAFGFDLCLLHSAVLLKGFKVVISGIMVCYFVSSRGARHSSLGWFLHRVSQSSLVIQNALFLFFFFVFLFSASVFRWFCQLWWLSLLMLATRLLFCLSLSKSLRHVWRPWFQGIVLTEIVSNNVFLWGWAPIVCVVVLLLLYTMELSWEKCA